MQAQTTVQTTVTVKLQPTVKHMLKARLEEHARLDKQIKELKAEKARKVDEVTELFVKAGEGEALINGTTFEGFRVKLVQPVRNVIDKDLLVELGCDPQWLVEATKEKPSKSYTKISAPGEKENSEDE